MKRTLAIMMSGLLLIPTFAAAQQKGGVELTSRAEVEVVQKSEKGDVLKRVEASKATVEPGDTVIFTISYVNNGEQPATDVAINNPIPEHMAYVDKSAEGTGARISFSVDSGKTYGTVEKLRVKTTAGKERLAASADITNIRWILEKPLTPGGKGSVSYRAKVK